MRKKLVVIISSLLCGFLVMSGGYGFWQKQLTITGRIEVRQEPVEETALTKSTLIAGGGGGGGEITIPNVPSDQTTDIEITLPTNQGETIIEGNNRNETVQDEPTEAADNPGQQQSTDSQDGSLGDAAVDDTPVQDMSTSDTSSEAEESSGSSASSDGATSNSSGSDGDQ